MVNTVIDNNKHGQDWLATITVMTNYYKMLGVNDQLP